MGMPNGSQHGDLTSTTYDRISRKVPGGVSQRFDRAIVPAGLPVIRLHDLRHTHATHMLAAGKSPRVVSERLGHESVAFTLDRYTHLLPTMQADAAEAVAALVDG
jgi:integrase